MNKFNLNDLVRDKVTGYSGRITALASYVSGETRYLVENVDSTGRPIEFWYDESRLVKEEK